MKVAAVYSSTINIDSISPLFHLIARYVFAVLLILLANSLMGLLPGAGSPLYLAALCLAVIVVCVCWASRALLKKEIASWFIWTGIVLGAYFAIFLITGDGRGGYGLISIGFFAICPLLLLLLMKTGWLLEYVRAYINIVTMLAVISLVLWVAGPITGMIDSNCSISDSWAGTGVPIQRPGYYCLLYITQVSNLFGFSLIRNTGVFAEAPMYSYVLCIAILLEVVFFERPRSCIVMALVVTVISTLSTTGIIFVFILSFFWAAHRLQSMESRLRPILLTVLAALLAVVSVASFMLLDQKLASASGSVRLDDFRAGYLAWSKRPIFGYGLGDSDALTLYMDGFRAYNKGFSNSLFDLLVRGGLVFAIPFFIALTGYFVLPMKLRTAALLFFYLWITTIVTFQPLTFLMFGVGAVGLIIDSQKISSYLQKGTQ